MFIVIFIRRILVHVWLQETCQIQWANVTSIINIIIHLFELSFYLTSEYLALTYWASLNHFITIPTV